MSQLSFLVDPDDVGLTSCLQKPNIELMNKEELDEMVDKLRDCPANALNSIVKTGRILLHMGVDTRQGYEEPYIISDSWKLCIFRVLKNLYVFILQPTNITAISSYKTGLSRIAKSHLNNSVDLDVWIRYNWVTKLFYLKEFALVIETPQHTEAMLVYTPYYSRSDYLRWIEEYSWPMPAIGFTYRKYLNAHVITHVSKLKSITKR